MAQRPSKGSAVSASRAAVHREKVPNFFSIYANDIQVQTSPWDMRLIIGDLDASSADGDPLVTIRQLGELRVSPQLGKRLAEILTAQVAAYEQQFGFIPGPHE